MNYNVNRTILNALLKNKEVANKFRIAILLSQKQAALFLKMVKYAFGRKIKAAGVMTVQI